MPWLLSLSVGRGKGTVMNGSWPTDFAFCPEHPLHLAKGAAAASGNWQVRICPLSFWRFHRLVELGQSMISCTKVNHCPAAGKDHWLDRHTVIRNHWFLRSPCHSHELIYRVTYAYHSAIVKSLSLHDLGIVCTQLHKLSYEAVPPILEQKNFHQYTVSQ